MRVLGSPPSQNGQRVLGEASRRRLLFDLPRAVEGNQEEGGLTDLRPPRAASFLVPRVGPFSANVPAGIRYRRHGPPPIVVGTWH